MTTEQDDEFAAFFSAHAEGLRRLGVFLTGDAEQGADLAQEALVRTYRHWRRIRGEDPLPYAKRTLVNLVRSAHRRRMVARAYAERLAPPPPGEPSRASEVEAWLTVADALRSLPPQRRAAIVLKFYDDMSEADIARTLDRPVNSIKSDIHRGLKKLRPLLQATVGGSAL
ncbi:MAG TPA: SigE family RNA polymerase sigma factor [Actinomycetota bacterium]|nr:SigE family RNA polymerase sigma factor [Actinomycetota bacterium]